MYVTPANVNDSQALDDIQHNLAQRDLLPDQQYVDQAYMSGEQIDNSAKRGIDLRGRVATHSSTKAEGFRLCDFDIDVAKQQAGCPRGKLSLRWSAVHGTKNVAYHAFLVACPFFRKDACTTLASGRRLDISLHHQSLQRRRQEQQTDEFKQDMKHRAAIEGTISEAVRAHGLRCNRYRALAKTQLQAHMTGATINLKRLMTVLPTPFVEFMPWQSDMFCFQQNHLSHPYEKPFVPLYLRCFVLKSFAFLCVLASSLLIFSLRSLPLCGLRVKKIATYHFVISKYEGSHPYEKPLFLTSLCCFVLKSFVFSLR